MLVKQNKTKKESNKLNKWRMKKTEIKETEMICRSKKMMIKMMVCDRILFEKKNGSRSCVWSLSSSNNPEHGVDDVWKIKFILIDSFDCWTKIWKIIDDFCWFSFVKKNNSIGQYSLKTWFFSKTFQKIWWKFIHRLSSWWSSRISSIIVMIWFECHIIIILSFSEDFFFQFFITRIFFSSSSIARQ